MPFTHILLELRVRLGRGEQVHQLHHTRTQQLLVQRRQLQLHLEVVLGIFLGLDPFPDPCLRGRHGAIRRGWTVRRALRRADDSLLRLHLGRLL